MSNIQTQTQTQTQKPKSIASSMPHLGIINAIFNLILALIDKIGIKAVDLIGTSLKLDYNDKTVSQQSKAELMHNLKELTEKLADPEYAAYLKQYIETIYAELEPVIRDKMTRISRLIMDLLDANAAELPKIIADALKAIPWLGSVLSAGSMVNDIAEFADVVTKKITYTVDEIRDGQAKFNTIVDANKFHPPTINANKFQPRTARSQNGGKAKKTQSYAKIQSRIRKSLRTFLR